MEPVIFNKRIIYNDPDFEGGLQTVRSYHDFFLPLTETFLGKSLPVRTYKKRISEIETRIRTKALDP